MKPCFCSAATSLALLAASACSRSNNVLLGRVEADVNGHNVVVTDCYRISVPPPERAPAGAETRFAPCRDAVVVFRHGELEVNGRSYGPIDSRDGVLVDHGQVSITRVSAHGSRIN